MHKLFFIIALLLSRASNAEIIVHDIKNNKRVDPKLYKAQEGFIALDLLNTVYGVEVVFSKDLGISEENKFQNNDSPELDLSFYQKNQIKTQSQVQVEIVNDRLEAKTLAINTRPVAGEYRLVTGAAKTVIKSEGGEDLFLIEWKTEKKGIISQGCSDDLIKIVEQKNTQPNSVLGLFCNYNLNVGTITVSPIKESKWLSANLAEVSGKGERYRTFEIPVGNLKGAVSGSFRINIANQNLAYSVFVKRIEDKAELFVIPFFKYFSAGMASATLQSPTASYSSSSFYYEFNGLTDFVYTNYKIGFGFYSSFSMSDDTSLITSRDSKLTMGYYSKNRTPFNWGVWLGHRNFDFKQDLSSLKFQSSQFGIGSQVEYEFSKISRVLGYAEIASLGSKVVSSHMKLGAHYKRDIILFKKQFVLGGILEIQNMVILTSTSENRTFGLTKFGASLDF